jgi:hypothetical protein
MLKRNGSVAWGEAGGIRFIDRAGDRIVGHGTELALSRSSIVFWSGFGDRTPAGSAPLH